MQSIVEQLKILDLFASDFVPVLNRTEFEIIELKQQLSRADAKFESEMEEVSSSFLKKPQDWVYLVGVPISVSAIFAVLHVIFQTLEKPEMKDKYAKNLKRLLKFTFAGSLSFMLLGFGILALIFFIIGGGPSYF